MRGGGADNGRFPIDYEAKSMYEGIGEELGATVGTQVDWFRWKDYYLDDHYRTIVDDIYDVSSSTVGEGKRWMLPFKLPVVMAQLIRSTNIMNERGYYVTDTLRIVVNAGDIQSLMPEMLVDPSHHIKDRILFQGEVFVPTRVLPRGRFANNYSVVTIDCNQVNAEELVNDPQFQQYASTVVLEPRNDLNGYGLNGYGYTPYGD